MQGKLNIFVKKFDNVTSISAQLSAQRSSAGFPSAFHCDHPCCVCPHTLLKSYAGCFNLSMWFWVHDRAMMRPRWLCNRGQQGTFHSGWWKLRTCNSKIRHCPGKTGTSGHPSLPEQLVLCVSIVQVASSITAGSVDKLQDYSPSTFITQSMVIHAHSHFVFSLKK